MANMEKEIITILAVVFVGALFAIIGLHSGECTWAIAGGSALIVGIILLVLWLKYKGYLST